MTTLIYGLIKFGLSLVFFVPLFFLIGLIDFLNTKGQLNEIEKDLKSLLHWMSGFDC